MVRVYGEYIGVVLGVPQVPGIQIRSMYREASLLLISGKLPQLTHPPGASPSLLTTAAHKASSFLRLEVESVTGVEPREHV